MKLFTIALFFLFHFSTRAQLEIKASNKEDFEWNKKDTAWISFFQEPATVFFHFNKDLTELTQTSIAEKINFCVQKWDYNHDELKYTMRVITDAGLQYELWIDGVNKQVVFFYWQKEKYLMSKFAINTLDLK